VENLALSSQAKRGKGKVRMNTGGDSSSQVGTGKDLSKVKCFHCHKKGHYASLVSREEERQKHDETRVSCIDKGSSG
jgi:hypothetical protein